MSMPKRIPYAVANYPEIVEDGYYFVDKTRFIHELEHYKIPVFLRPRRFGKSLWCSILECYYDINRKDRFERLFGQTDIGRNPTPSRNSQLVLRFDFSVVQVKARLDSLEESFDAACRDAIRVFAAENRRHADFSGAMDAASATDALRFIISTIRSQACPPLHVIIDEYDNFTNQLLTARQDQLYQDVTTGESFLRTFYKVIKAGVGEGTVARVFITGVLPVTMDDLTSCFNIGQIITLKEHTLEMMGFTQAETDAYLDEIFADHGWSGDKRHKVGDALRIHYDGYHLLPDTSEPLYNSTICNFYLSDLVINKGKFPTETIDHNLRVDINWLRRLTGSDEETRQLLEQLMFDGTLPVDLNMLGSKFNMKQFFEKRFFPLSLYYLGMLTFRNEFTLQFPNLTVKRIFTEYFNEVEHIEVSLGYTDMFQQFLVDHDWAALFAGYWQQYVGQIPAQAFDKVNENFFRTTFYELCTRYLSRHLMFAIEVNHATGRSDWEAIGRAGTPFENQAELIEFKHFPLKEGKRLGVERWTEPRPADVEQIDQYARDLQRRYPELTIRRHVVYTLGAKKFRFFSLDAER
jgi:hypothetical protein